MIEIRINSRVTAMADGFYVYKGDKVPNLVATGSFAQGYILPEGMSYADVFGVGARRATRTIKKLYLELVRLNPELKRISVKYEKGHVKRVANAAPMHKRKFLKHCKDATEFRKMAHVIRGVGSKFNVENIRYYIEDLACVSYFGDDFDDRSLDSKWARCKSARHSVCTTKRKVRK